MKKNQIEELINKSLQENLHPEMIDVRNETMTQIINYEKRKEKNRSMLQWALTTITFFASLFSLYIFEILAKRFSFYFQVYAVNILTVKFFLQVLFTGILLAVVVIIINTLSLSTKKPAYHFF
jgi:hypothetical protein